MGCESPAEKGAEMGYRNAAYNARNHGPVRGVRFGEGNAVIALLATLATAFALALALSAVTPAGVAFADDADDASNASSVADGSTANDASLSPSDPNGLKTQAEGDAAPTDPENSDQPEEITVTIYDSAGAIVSTLNIEKGKAITFVDENDNVLAQYVAAEPTITAPVPPTKDGYDFVGWSVKVNDKGNAVATTQYQVKSTPTPTPTTDEVKTVRSSNGTVTTNSPKTGDLLSVAIPVGVAVVALVAILVLLFTRRRNR